MQSVANKPIMLSVVMLNVIATHIHVRQRKSYFALRCYFSFEFCREATEVAKANTKLTLNKKGTKLMSKKNCLFRRSPSVTSGKNSNLKMHRIAILDFSCWTCK
jgi:hypothetical protein